MSEGENLFEIGEYTGEKKDGLPHGKGVIIYKETDPSGRIRYEGDWFEGRQHGEGSVNFVTGECFCGEFESGIPHGAGVFTYPNQDKEEVIMDHGARHGKSKYISADDETTEDLMFWEGEARGPSKLIYSDGSFEERTYSEGGKNGEAKYTGANGDIFTFNYKDNVIHGPSKYTWADGRYEEVEFISGAKHGPGLEVDPSGQREERIWSQGVLEGPAVLTGSNGDRLEFTYIDGVKSGPATYKFSDGSIEISVYSGGEQTGPAKLTWPNGATREGLKRNGVWDGDCFYTFVDGPRAGKKDIEKWKEGELISTQKYYGKDGEQITVEDWQDLKKLEELTSSCDNFLK